MKLNKNAVVSNCGQCEYQNTSMYYYCEKLKRDTISHPIPSDCPLADVMVLKIKDDFMFKHDKGEEYIKAKDIDHIIIVRKMGMYEGDKNDK